MPLSRRRYLALSARSAEFVVLYWTAQTPIVGLLYAGVCHCLLRLFTGLGVPCFDVLVQIDIERCLSRLFRPAFLLVASRFAYFP